MAFELEYYNPLNLRNKGLLYPVIHNSIVEPIGFTEASGQMYYRTEPGVESFWGYYGGSISAWKRFATQDELLAQNLAFQGDTGTGSINFSTQTFSIVGTTDEIVTLALNQSLQIGLPDSIKVVDNIIGGDPKDHILWGNAGANNITIGETLSTVVIPGNLTVWGTQTVIDTEILTVEDPLIELARDNSASDVIDIGVYGIFYDSESEVIEQSGIFRDASSVRKEWGIFKSGIVANNLVTVTEYGDLHLHGIDLGSKLSELGETGLLSFWNRQNDYTFSIHSSISQTESQDYSWPEAYPDENYAGVLPTDFGVLISTTSGVMSWYNLPGGSSLENYWTRMVGDGNYLKPSNAGDTVLIPVDWDEPYNGDWHNLVLWNSSDEDDSYVSIGFGRSSTDPRIKVGLVGRELDGQGYFSIWLRAADNGDYTERVIFRDDVTNQETYFSIPVLMPIEASGTYVTYNQLTGQISYDNVSNIPGVSYWERDVNNGYLFPGELTDYVGIGTEAPSEFLEVAGNIALSEGSNRSIYVTPRIVDGNGYNLTLIAGTGHGEGGLGGDIYIKGGLGGGVMAPQGGNVYIHGGRSDGHGNVLLAWDGSDETGFVGVGVATPAVMLHVNGSFGLINASEISVDTVTSYIDINSTDTQIPTSKAVFTVFKDIGEPNGFPSRATSIISFDNGTRQLTIDDVGTSFEFYSGFVKYIKDTPQTVVISDIEGLWYFYFNVSGVLTATQSFSRALLTDYAIVAILYWDSTNKLAIYLGDERHGTNMDSATHVNIHLTEGTKWVAPGLGLAEFTIGNGNLDAHAQFGYESGEILDEDLFHTVIGQSSPAQIPIFYLSGSNSWRKITATNFPLTTIGTGRVAYNLYSGSTWSLVEVNDNNFVLYHYFAINCQYNKFIGIPGQGQYATRNEAELAAYNEIYNLYLGGLPFAEFLPIGTVIFQTKNSYTNIVNAKVVSLSDGSNWIDWRRTKVADIGNQGGAVQYWTRDVSNGYLFPTSLVDRVGIGTITPEEPLDIVGNTKITSGYLSIYRGSSSNAIDIYRDTNVQGWGSEINYYFKNSNDNYFPYAAITGGVWDNTEGDELGYMTLMVADGQGGVTSKFFISSESTWIDNKVGVGMSFGQTDVELAVNGLFGLTNYLTVSVNEIVTSITDLSTDIQIPTAKACWDIVGSIEDCKWVGVGSDIYRNSYVGIGNFSVAPTSRLHLIDNAKYLKFGHTGTQAFVNVEDKLDIQLSAISIITAESSLVTVSQDLKIPINKKLYIGNEDTNGSWRIYDDGVGHLIVEQRVGGGWTFAGKFTAG